MVVQSLLPTFISTSDIKECVFKSYRKQKEVTGQNEVETVIFYRPFRAGLLAKVAPL